jgi:DNA-binding LacI/PurR family transcriptional regulator
MRAIPSPSRPTRKVTSIDVAREAGVSQATVSLVMSGKAAGRISEATADQVRRAAKKLGYRPNTAARALRSGTASAVGLVVSDVTHPFFGRTLRGAQKAAWDADHVVVLIDDGYGAAWGDGSVETLRTGSIDGFVFFAADPPPSLKRPGSPPIVVVEREHQRFPFVRLDVDEGIRLLLDHLDELGHRRIGYLMSERRGETFDRRHAAWAAQLRGYGIDPATMPTTESRFYADATIAAGHRLLERRDEITAVICDDDVLASGLVAAARDLGVDIPGELSVVGFDDLDLARLSATPLTTIRFDSEGLGAAAFEVLHERLQGKRPKSRVLPVELVVRASTGPAPA